MHSKYRRDDLSAILRRSVIATIFCLQVFVCDPVSSSSFMCPFTILANQSVHIDRESEIKRLGITAEEFDEELGKLVWCLPKSYMAERPPFIGR